jgi:hypothetical protein
MRRLSAHARSTTRSIHAASILNTLGAVRYATGKHMSSKVVPTGKPSKTFSGEPEESGEFLLAEFNQLCELWRYADKRIESTLNTYFTVRTLVISGLFFLFQQVQDLRSLITLTIPIATALLVGGMALTRRIQETDILKERYDYAINLIKNYFVDNDARIAEYLFLRFDVGQNAAKLKIRQFLKIGFLLRSTLVWNSLLLGYVSASIAWLVEPRFLLEVPIGVGIMIALLTFVLLNLTMSDS